MKRNIVLFLAMIVLQQVYAQKSELSVSYGIPTNKNLNTTIGDAFNSALIGGLLNSAVDNESFTGAFNLEYMYRLDTRWAVGVDLGYEHSSSDLKVDKAVVAKIKDSYLTAMVGAKYYWANGEKFRVYAKVAIGVSITKEKITNAEKEDYSKDAENDTDVAYQVSPIAFEVGKNYCGFLELGYGNQGIAQIGVRVRF